MVDRSASRSTSPRDCPASRWSAWPTPPSRRPGARPGRDQELRVRLPAAPPDGQPRACRAPQDGRVARSGDGDRDPARVRAGPRRTGGRGVHRRARARRRGATGPGILPMAAALADRGIERLVLAVGAVEEARLVSGIEVDRSRHPRRGRRDRPTQAPSAPTGRETTGDDGRPWSGRRAASARPGRGDPGSSGGAWPGGGATRARDRPRR